MVKAAYIYGLFLIAIGIGGYYLSGGVTKTALIPAFFGLPVVLLAFLACKENLRKHAMHGLAALSLLGVFGTIKGLGKLPALLSGEQLERPLAVASQSLMAIASIIFLILAIKSFIAARKARQ